MKKLLLFVSIFLITVTLAYAGPASQEIFDIDQPDGTTFKARVKGDEFQNWMEAVDSGHTVIREEATGYWVYADKMPDGALTSSGLRVDPTGRMAPANIKSGLYPPRDKQSEQRQNDTLKRIYNERLSRASAYDAGRSDKLQFGTATAQGWVPQPVSGTRKLLLVLVGFSDRALKTSPDSWHNALFSTAASAKSVANYFKDNSFGNLSIVPAAHTLPGHPAGVVTVNFPAQKHPNPPDNDTTSGETSWIPGALDALDQYVHFSSYDTNGNGVIDRSELLVYFILAGYEQSTGKNLSPSVWAHASPYEMIGGLSAVGMEFPVFSISGELYDTSNPMPMGVIAHELGHQIGGFPDLYDISDTEPSNEGLGRFSLMASGNWGKVIGETPGTTPVALDAWTREYAGWGIPRSPAAGGSLNFGAALSGASSAVKLINPLVSATEYWLVENRHPSGWDMGITGVVQDYAGGLLITHIDLAIGTPGMEPGSAGSNDINKYGTGAHQGVVPEQAKSAACDMLAVNTEPGCRGSTTTTFYSGNNASFGALTTPNSNYYSGAASGFEINNISVRGTSMTATVIISGLPVSVVPGVPMIGTATAGNAQATVSFTPPASDGGSAIKSYTVTSIPSGITKTGTTSPITVTGLTNGTSYTFTIKATNSVGTSSSSAASNSVKPVSASITSGNFTTTFVSNVTGANGNMFDVKVLGKNVAINSVDLNLNATAGKVVPVSVFYKTGSYRGYEKVASAWTRLGTYSVNSAGKGKPSSMTFDKGLILESGKTYGIYLTATDGTSFAYTTSETYMKYKNTDLEVTLGASLFYPFNSGSSPKIWNGTIRYTTGGASATYPDAPTNVTATAGNGTSTVSFTPGAVGSGTLVNYYAACGIDNKHLIYASGKKSPITVTGLANGTAYYCWVKAQSTVGNGSWSTNSKSVVPTSVSTASAMAIEFYNAKIDHYFMTASTDEATVLDNKPEWNWTRTGKTFNIWLSQSIAPENASPVCRFFGVFSNGTIGSHFYTVDATECDMVKGRLDWGWGYENDAFYAVKPTGTSCPSGTSPIYRAYNNGMGGAPNHRYVATQAEVDTMVALGWVSEGTALCGVQ